MVVIHIISYLNIVLIAFDYIIISISMSIFWNQIHFLIMILEPTSSYSALSIHWFLKVESDASTEPPIQTEYLRSFCAMTLTFMVDATSLLTSISRRSSKPCYMDEPPDKMMFSYCCLRASISTLSTDLCTSLWIGSYSRLIVKFCPSLASNITSGHWHNSLPSWITFSSGSLTSTLVFLPLSNSATSALGSLAI